jgi:hypothetical protein
LVNGTLVISDLNPRDAHLALERHPGGANNQ